MVAPVLLSVAQAAARLGISPAVVYAALQAGTLPGYRFGRPGKRGVWRIEAYQLDQWKETLKVSAPPAATPSRPAPRLRHISLD